MLEAWPHWASGSLSVKGEGPSKFEVLNSFFFKKKKKKGLKILPSNEILPGSVTT